MENPFDNIKKYKEKVYDKISQLLIEKFTQLETSLNMEGLENFQIQEETPELFNSDDSSESNDQVFSSFVEEKDENKEEVSKDKKE